MRKGSDVPRVGDDATLAAAIVEMSGKGMGMTAVVDGSGRALGIFTDGDLRRTLERHESIRALRVADVMTRKPTTIGPDRLAASSSARATCARRRWRA
jgi:arabinose-5-phosphate isomerase